MKDIFRRLGLTALLVGFFIGLLPVPASEPPQPKSITETLKPFVDSKGIAGAVTLVADKDKVRSWKRLAPPT